MTYAITFLAGMAAAYAAGWARWDASVKAQESKSPDARAHRLAQQGEKA